MAKATYWQKGATIDYTPSAAVAANDIVALGTARCGVAGGDIKANETGALFVEGVFVFPHDAAAAAGITLGAAVYWDATNSVVTTTASGNIPLGWCVEACAKTATEVKVKMG